MATVVLLPLARSPSWAMMGAVPVSDALPVTSTLSKTSASWKGSCVGLVATDSMSPLAVVSWLAVALATRKTVSSAFLLVEFWLMLGST